MRKTLYALLALAAITTLACQKDDEHEPAQQKATVVLVHGAW
ncbi:hypothetical protein [Hymenobacter profundi]|nr:hypothetical protein [Hymenobacter profundi]